MAEYEFLRPPLGRGAFGVTFKARKRGAGSVVAIKRSTRGSDDEATRAIREAIHLLRLDHRNLVKVLEWTFSSIVIQRRTNRVSTW